MEKKRILVLDEDIEEEIGRLGFISNPAISIFYANEDTVYDHLNSQFFNIAILCKESLKKTMFYDLLKTVRTISPQTRVLITTSKGDVDSFIKFLNMGVYDYFIKPFDPFLFNQAVFHALKAA